MGIDLSVQIGSLTLKNPVMLASGCCAYGTEMEEYLDLARVGGVCLKGLSLNGSEGNPPPRIWETQGGMLNAIGLQNVGVKVFLEEKVPLLEGTDTVFVANFYGSKVEEYVATARALDAIDMLSALEMNISCPNISEGGIHFGTKPESVLALTKACREATKKPLWVKLSPNAADVAEIARAAEEGGADALTCINTMPAMAIDIEKRTFRLSNRIGGLSGPAIKPVAVRVVYQVSRAVSIPVVGVGGISKAEDVVELMLAGASAVQVGTALFTDPYCPLDIIAGIEDYCERHGFKSVSELTGAVND